MLCALPTAAHADILTLASGDEIRGRILSEVGGTIVVEVPGGEVRFPRSQVIDIVREKPGAYALEKGEELLRIGALEEAANLLRRALDAGEGRAALRLASAERRLAERARAQGDLPSAEARLRGALEAASRDAAGGGAEAAEARALLAGIAAQRLRARELVGAGVKQTGEGRTEAALASLREAIALDRGVEAQASSWLGRAAAEEGNKAAAAGQYARASVHFEEALRRTPALAAQLARAAATCQLGVAIERLRAGDPASAVSALQAGLALDPEAHAVRFFLGVTHELRGERLEAAAHYRLTVAAARGGVPDGQDLTPLREAAIRAAGRLPVDPEEFLAAARSQASEGALAYTATRGPIEVRAPGAELGQQVLEAALRAAEDVAAWAGPLARETPVRVTILPSKEAFREATGASEGTVGLTRTRLDASDGARLVYSYAGAKDLLASVIPHEITHATAYGPLRGAVPLWLNEGLAISSEPAAEIQSRARSYRTELARGTALPLQEVIRLRGYPDESRKGSFYGAAAAFTGWLIERAGRGRVLDLARRASTMTLDAAFRDVLDFADADAAVAAYLASVSQERK